MVRTKLTLITSRQWPARHQLDVSNAFLHGRLSEQVYCQQPVGYIDSKQPDAISLKVYRLKHVLRAWYLRFTGFITQLGFNVTWSDISLFVLRRGQLDGNSSVVCG